MTASPEEELDHSVRRIRRLMAERGVTQNHLADVVNVSQGHMSKVLSGTVRAGPKLKVALDAWTLDPEPHGDFAAATRIVERLCRRGTGHARLLVEILAHIEKLMDHK